MNLETYLATQTALFALAIMRDDPAADSWERSHRARQVRRETGRMPETCDTYEHDDSPETLRSPESCDQEAATVRA